MSVVLSVAIGLIVWVITWSLGWRNLDGGLVFLVIVLIGGTIHLIGNLLPGNQDQTQANPDAAPFT